MTVYPHHATETHRWALTTLLALLLQTLAFAFWLGEISGTVRRNTTLLDQLRSDLTAHMNQK